MPRSIGVLQPLVLAVLVGASRAVARYWLGGIYTQQLRRYEMPRAIIYGAGSAGQQLARALASSSEVKVVGFVDDDERLHGQILGGLEVYPPSALPWLISHLGVRDVLLATPSLPRRRRQEILQHLASLRVAVRTVPSVNDLVCGRISVADLRDIDFNDLLGREPVEPNWALLRRNVTGKVVLVTGAGGSIGSELCRQVWELRPSRLVLVEQSEYALYSIFEKLAAAAPERRHLLIPLLASVQDARRMANIMSTWQPDTVYHAAAYKHVPLVEENPTEGVKNNVFGTLRTLEAALASGVSDFILISTDKAVRPTSMMGASKRLAEMILQAQAACAVDTRLSVVRFGNVLGSSGSVVPKFWAQIRAGGPVTVTHPDATRYFMSAAEAAQLVMQAGAMAQGGEVFFLQMGEPVRILDLARRMVELAGLTVRDQDHPDGDIEIVFIGLRPGEKLHEELLLGSDPQPTDHPRILRAREPFMPWSELKPELSKLARLLQAEDTVGLRQLLARLIADYKPHEQILDHVYRARQSRAA